MSPHFGPSFQEAQTLEKLCLKNLWRTFEEFEELEGQQISNKHKARNLLWRPFDPSSNQIEENFALESRPQQR